MVELLGYLEANGFTNYIVSGGGRDFMPGFALWGAHPARPRRPLAPAAPVITSAQAAHPGCQQHEAVFLAFGCPARGPPSQDPPSAWPLARIGDTSPDTTPLSSDLAPATEMNALRLWPCRRLI